MTSEHEIKDFSMGSVNLKCQSIGSLSDMTQFSLNLGKQAHPRLFYT